jgi:hypothetical protein
MNFKSFYQNYIKEELSSNEKYQNLLKFFYATKSLLSKGDDFKFNENSDPNLKDNAANITFIYNGTRNIKVFYNMWYRNTNTINDTTVSIYENYTKLDTNVFHNPIAKNTEELSFDPKIQSPHDFINYIQSVLDRNDRNNDDNDHEPTPPNPSSSSQSYIHKKQKLISVG